MANVIEVLIKGLVSDDFKKALNQASQSVEGFANKVAQSVENASKRFEGMNKGFDAFGKSMIGIGAALSIGITAPTVALAAGAVKAGANIEKLTIAFQPLLGSAQAATKRMGELQQFANYTPFALPEVAKASRMLEVMTKGALATGDALRMVGDVASGVGLGFDEVAMWVGRLYDGLKSGRPVGEATMRLQEMGAMSGDTRNKLEQMSASGAKFSEVWAVATQAFGRFAGGMELQSNSVEGKISTLGDSAQTALAALGRSFEDATKTVLDFATAVTDKLGALAELFGRLPAPVKYVTLAVVALAAALGPLLVALGALLLAIPGLIAGFAAIAPLVAAFAASFGPLVVSASAYIIVGAAVAASLVAIVVAIKSAVEWWNTYREASQKAADAEKATEDALARRAVGADYRRALRKAGIETSADADQWTSQSQQGGSFAAFQQQQAIATIASDEAAAKIREEFVKTDRASLIAAETKKYEEQKKVLGDNAEALMQLNALHKQALEDIDKKTLKIKKPKAVEETGEEKNQREIDAFLNDQAEKKAKHEENLQAKLYETRKKQEDRIEKDQIESFERMKARFEPMVGLVTNVASRITTAFGSIFAPLDQLFGRMEARNQKMTSSWTKAFQGIGLAFAKMAVDLVKDLVMMVAKILIQVALLKAVDYFTGGMVSAVMGVKSTATGGSGMLGAVMKMNGVPSFDVGTPRVPRDMLAQIHEGEMIIPKSFAQGMRDGDVPMGGGRSASLVLGSDIIRVLKTEGRALVQITENQGKVSFA